MVVQRLELRRTCARCGAGLPPGAFERTPRGSYFPWCSACVEAADAGARAEKAELRRLRASVYAREKRGIERAANPRAVRWEVSGAAGVREVTVQHATGKCTVVSAPGYGGGLAAAWAHATFDVPIVSMDFKARPADRTKAVTWRGDTAHVAAVMSRLEAEGVARRAPWWGRERRAP